MLYLADKRRLLTEHERRDRRHLGKHVCRTDNMAHSNDESSLLGEENQEENDNASVVESLTNGQAAHENVGSETEQTARTGDGEARRQRARRLADWELINDDDTWQGQDDAEFLRRERTQAAGGLRSYA